MATIYGEIDAYQHAMQRHQKYTKALKILQETDFFTITLINRKTGDATSLDAQDLSLRGEVGAAISYEMQSTAREVENKKAIIAYMLRDMGIRSAIELEEM